MNEVFPKWLVSALGALLMVFIALLIAGKAKDLNDTFSNKNPKNTMSVSAEGKVSGTPDLATLTLGVVSQGKNAAEVQDQNSSKINKIIEFVKQQGITKDDISTSQFNIYPRYDYSIGKNEINGYEARQTITIKVRGVNQGTEKLGKVIDGATNNGANEVSGVSLSFEDPDNLKQTARQKAIEKAKEKAEELARSAGIELGKVVSVSESGGYGYPMPMYAENMGGGFAFDAMKSASPNIEPGSQDIVAQMTVVFEVK